MRSIICALLGAVLLIGGCVPAPVPPESPQNVLFLFSDDQRADTIAAHGNPVIQTPNLDALAGEGYSFRRAYVMGADQGAVCMPSRAMLLTGRNLFRVYGSLDGVTTYPEMWRADGYTTFATGKWHQSQESFARSFSVGRNVFFGGMADHFAVPIRDLNDDGTFTEPVEAGYSAELFADAAVEFLEGRTGSDEPFLAYVSFTTPHDPRTPPEEYLAPYPAASMPLPASFMPVHPFHNGWLTGRDEQLAAWPRTGEVIRAQIAEYYGLISHLDTQVGRVLDALERSGHADRTVVVFAGDNGLALGSHGLLGKQSLYEHSSRVPLIVAGPGIPHGESEALVYLYDVFPTLAALLGEPPLEGSEGEDLSPIWRGERPAVRDSIFTAYEDLMRAVQEDGWKLIRYPPIDHTQLFDLTADPDELVNVAGDPAQASRVERLLALLAEWQERTGDPAPLSVDEPLPLDYDYATFTRAPDRWQPESIRRKYFP